MSLGGSKSTAVNSAVANAVSAGVFMAVAAGNEAQDAKNVSPASEATAFTVGASDSADKIASFSNYGTLVDIMAPGVSILSTWLNGGTVSQPVLYSHRHKLTDWNRTPSQVPQWLLPTLLVLRLTFSPSRARCLLLLLLPAFRLLPQRTSSLAFPPAPRTTLLSMVTPAVKRMPSKMLLAVVNFL